MWVSEQPTSNKGLIDIRLNVTPEMQELIMVRIMFGTADMVFRDELRDN